MIITGKNSVQEALQSGKTVEKIMVKKNAGFSQEQQELLSQAKERGIRVEFLEKMAFEKLVQNTRQTSIAAQVTDFQYAELEDCFALAQSRGEDILLVLLDGVQDPHNLGSVLRVAECAGAHGVIIPKHRSVSVNETVVRVSAGAAEHMLVVKAGNLNQTIETLKQRGVWVYALDMDGANIYTQSLKGPVALVVGGEGTGVSALVRKNVDAIVSFPLKGKVNSLNASVATGIAVYEVVRQREQI